jgi:hypothetical protein
MRDSSRKIPSVGSATSVCFTVFVPLQTKIAYFATLLCFEKAAEKLYSAHFGLKKFSL